MLVNNEVGTIQPLDAVAEVVRERAPRRRAPHRRRPGAAAGSTCATPPRAADLVTLSVPQVRRARGHRRAASCATASRLAAQQLGGGQERERRSGTQDVAGAVGVRRRRRRRPPPSAAALVAARRRAGATGWSPRSSPASPAPSRARRPPGDRPPPRGRHRHVCLPGVESEALLFLLEHEHRRAGRRRRRAAPAAPRSRPTCWPPWASTAALAAGSLRLSLGWSTTEADVDAAVAGVPDGRRVACRRHARDGAAGVTPSACSWRCRAGSTRRWPPPCSSRRATRWSGVTLKLWGGESDSGCCSVADVDDARRVARRLGIEHHVFNFGDDFDEPRGGALRRRPRRRPHAQPVHRVQPPPQVRPAPAPGRRARLRRRRHRPPRPRRRRGPTAPAGWPGAPTRPRTSPTCCTCSTRTQLGRVRFPVGRPDQGRGAGRGRPPRAAHRGQARQPGRLLHHRHRRPRARFLGDRITTTPGSGGRRRRRRRSARSTRWSWSPSASATASACPGGSDPRYVRRRRRPGRHRHRRGRGRPARRRASRSTTCAGSAGPVDGPLLAQAAPTARRGRCRVDGRPRRVRRARPPRGARPERGALRRRRGRRRRLVA